MNTLRATGPPPVETVRFTSREWDFVLDHPADWHIAFENQADPPYMLPVSLMGPRGLRGYPAVTIQVNLITAQGFSLDGYMRKAEDDLRSLFPGFHPLRRWQEPLLGAPAVWMTYHYQGESGPRQELNATAFIGQERMLWLQFIAETDREDSPRDIPLMERIIHSLRPGPTGIRVPHLVLTGASGCELCGKRFAPNEPTSAVFRVDPVPGQLMAICGGCRRPA